MHALGGKVITLIAAKWEGESKTTPEASENTYAQKQM